MNKLTAPLFENSNHALLDLVPAALVAVDEAGIVCFANQAAQDLTGYDRANLLGHSIDKLIVTGNRFSDLASLGSLFKQSHLSLITHKNGNHLPVIVSENPSIITDHQRDQGDIYALLCLQQTGDLGSYIQSLENQLIEFRVHVEDMQFTQQALEAQGTELARISEEIGYARDMANEANRAKSDFLATMSHELRTPLNGIMGMAGVLMDSKLDTVTKQNIQTIYDSGQILLELLNDILDLSKIEAGHLELELIAFDMIYVLKQLRALWMPRMAAKGLDFILDIDDDVPNFILSDPVRIRQIISNLVNNAIKFTPQGSITLTVSKSGSGFNAGKLLFSVADTGIGIMDDKVDSLFEKFTQADSSTTRKYGGTGLGLAICKQLSELLGGTITAESSFGLGSKFSIEIPYQEAEASDAERWHSADHVNQTISYLPVNILIAEDNPVNQIVLTKMLEKKVDHITTVENGKLVLEVLETGTYDVILMDIQMPELDGVETTHKIREDSNKPYYAIPIIALTANAMSGDREYYLKNGMDDYVSKPINQADLINAIERHCRSAIDGQKTSGSKRDTVPSKSVAASSPASSASSSAANVTVAVKPATSKAEKDALLNALLDDL